MKIQQLEILNFKSISNLKLNCKRINIFIGQPNTGKSNILEGLGLLTLFNNESKITDLARFETMYNLFHDNDIENPVEIKTDKHRLKMVVKENFEVYVETKTRTAIKNYDLYYDSQGKLLNPNPHYTSPVKYYQFRPDNHFYDKSTDFLKPPHAENLVTMLLKNRSLRKQVGKLFTNYGFKFVLNPQESSILIQKEDEGIVISYPYTLASATLQRYVFYITAIETNKESVLIFDEPETSSSTEYTSNIAEKIAADDSNQYFISTHHPNFLLTLLEKAKADVSIFFTYFEDYETKIKEVNEAHFDAISSKNLDLFHDLEKFIEKE